MDNEIKIIGEDVQSAIQKNPAFDWALKEESLQRQIRELKEKLSKYEKEEEDTDA
tara:strand:- start:596 stop:760 length:165 start_codon:yes stop_codon:yes gene_type:complete